MDEFKETVWDYYVKNKRELPWRVEPFVPYRILISEIMLQQTQVSRVIPKYSDFLKLFPDIHELANASLADVLRAWNGLGYNRRAKYLHEAAKQIEDKNSWTIEDLENCKGIGKNTAAAIIVYSYNRPLVFIETNIRTVYIHHFLNREDLVDDKEIIALVQKSLDQEHPRDFYYAIMDYGTHLKKIVGNTARQSKHYAKQSRFEGSVRQLRGEILRQLDSNAQSLQELKEIIQDDRLAQTLLSLEKDLLITVRKDKYRLG